MRVLHLVQKPQRRGAELFARSLSEWLEGAGHEALTAYLYPSDDGRPLPLGPRDVVLGRREDALAERFPGAQPRLLAALRALVREADPDIVQLNGGRSVKYGAALSALAPKRRFALVYRNIGDPRHWLRGWWKRLLFRHLVLRRVDGAVAISEAFVPDLRAATGGRSAVTHIPNAVSDAYVGEPPPAPIDRGDWATPESAFVALFLGSLTAEKRVDRFLRVIAGARRRAPHVVGWVVGDGPLRGDAQALARGLGVQEHVCFAGRQQDAARWIASADILVSTSDTEGAPAAVLEAGALGRPVVATRVGAVPECVLDGASGFLANAGDEDALVARVVELAGDADLRARAGARARAHVRERFTMQAIGPRYLAFYGEVVAMRTSRR